MSQGYQCGMLWGAALAAGAHAHRLLGPGTQTEMAGLQASQALVQAFILDSKHLNCLEITELNLKALTEENPTSKRQQLAVGTKFLLKGGPIVCFRMAARYARAAFAEVNRMSAETPPAAPPGPTACAASCAAQLARQMGASAMQVSMAAGLGGGIGLSGGACGALGAAIWMLGVKYLQAGASSIGFAPPRADETLQKFLEASGYEFECEKIVGRTFASPADHAAYVQAGGCAEIIAALSRVI